MGWSPSTRFGERFLVSIRLCCSTHQRTRKRGGEGRNFHQTIPAIMGSRPGRRVTTASNKPQWQWSVRCVFRRGTEAWRLFDLILNPLLDTRPPPPPYVEHTSDVRKPTFPTLMGQPLAKPTRAINQSINHARVLILQRRQHRTCVLVDSRWVLIITAACLSAPRLHTFL